jgi:putative phage-type endonuclease
MTPEALQRLLQKPTSQEWLDERASYLGGTDIAAILTDVNGKPLHKYKTPLQVFLEKKGLKQPVELNEAMVHGINLEPYVAYCYSRYTGKKVKPAELVRDSEVPYFAANPDFEVIGESRLLECKTAGYFVGVSEFGEGHDHVPDQYLVQCQWYLGVTGKDVCDLGAFIGGQEFRLYTIERDDSLINHIRQQAKEWWEAYILSDCPPPITGEDPDTDWVKSSYRQDDGEIIFAPPEIDELCVQLREARALASKSATEKARLENCIKEAMKTASTLQSSAGPITWKTNAAGVRVFKPAFYKENSKCQTAA